MRLNENKRVFFDPTAHLYLLDGERLLMGVTSLMKKHGLSADYSGIAKKVLDAAAAEGTAIHQEIEDYDNGKAVLISPLIQEYRELGLKFIANEYLVSDNDIVASAIDGVYEGEHKNGVILVDYKATQKVHKRALSWQLGIYKVFFERQNPTLKVEKTLCLHIDKKERKIKGLIPIDPVSEEEVTALLTAEKNGEIYCDNYSEPNVEVILSGEELNAYVANQSEIAKLKEAVKEIESVLKEYDKRILEYMKSHNLDKMDAPDGTISIKKGYTRVGIDTEKLKKKRPDIFAQFTKETSVSPSIIYKPNS